MRPTRTLTHPNGPGAPVREWLVTNGLGGYASGTLAGSVNRRYHGLLVAALPAPVGRTVMLTHVHAWTRLPSGRIVMLDAEPVPAADAHSDDSQPAMVLAEFTLELGLPIWRYEEEGVVIEKRIVMPHRQNTVHLTYRLLESRGPIRIDMRPFLNVRHYESPVAAHTPIYTLTASQGRFEVSADVGLPALRLLFHGRRSTLTLDTSNVLSGYFEEQSRGYDHSGALWSPGYFQIELDTDHAKEGTVVASTESWELIEALTPAQARDAETARRQKLLETASTAAHDSLGAELVLAADQFIITPAARPEDAARAQALGTEARTVIAGYHWFTDWGRDTMISLEGLTLVTGRVREAALILHTFASYIRDGLIPNMFPDGESQGVYHTADATLWYFQALARYVDVSGDRAIVRALLPALQNIIAHHLSGTRFGIGVDPADGLLRQGDPALPLTWMDAKVDGWVVTPRRGKAVEINALFYNALRLLESWVRDARGAEAADPLGVHAERVRTSFNRRFWFEPGGYLYDVVDGESGDDASCRPNQILAMSLTHPVLDRSRWTAVLDTARQTLLTPYGLRSLAPGNPGYQSKYYGDLRSRDAAYHQGTVWAWLIGPFVDAWVRVHPGDRQQARGFLTGFDKHLNDAGVGSISEIFDADAPFTPRGCIAQAWSVAEVLRAWTRTDPQAPPDPD
jgi:predicted glycogen debranching enzyme